MLEGYASIGFNSREPARNDMLAGFDNLDTSNDAFVGSFERVRPEHVQDLEAGVRYRTAAFAIDANAFSMRFRDEILPIGQLSYIGTPLRQNVRASARRGVETDLTAHPIKRLTLGLTATAMNGRIADFTDDQTSQAYHNVEPLLTPKFTSSQRVTVDISRALSTTLFGAYYGRSQLNNTNDPALALPSYYVLNAAADWKIRSHVVSLHVNNATNAKAFASGHVSGGEARYYVMPPINLYLTAKLCI
jgi:iron complex outermembrane receptor protein